ncbi:MAG: hypothetical protein PWQ79_77 [Thermococcaceae archaeon]|nr:hypothetical protein [Thermococcaceae archaeon]MDK2913162.1 hypothetical protein [Thermococcaceae archaeon]
MEREIKLERVLGERDPVKKAYLAGYLIGYGGHSEWSGWARELRDKVMKEAESAGVLEKALKAYREGKKAGSERRERDIREGIYSSSIEEEIPKIKPKRVRVSIGPENYRSDVGKLPRSIQMARFVGLGGIFRRRRMGLPGFLRRI